MKRKHALFLVIPALLLVGCGNGPEITDEKVIAEKTSAVKAKLPEMKNFEFVIDTDGTSYDEKAKKNVSNKSHILYQKNEDGEVYCKTETTSDGKKSGLEYYLVNNTTYQQVMYADVLEDGEHKIGVYAKTLDALSFGLGEFYTLIPEMYISMFADPTALSTLAKGEGNSSTDVSLKYYSKGDGNLTVVVTAVPKDLASVKAASKENEISTTMEIKYEDNFFTTAKVESKTNKGGSSKMEAKLSLKKKQTFTLPTGWEAKISPSATNE